MVREVSHPPNAPAIVESLRAIGYSFETAVADIVDNSIAAGAKRIEIRSDTGQHPYVAIIDDGRGMSPDDLLEAMRHGGIGPGVARAAGDLGRFGLGLKTASLSQCRRLTVVTRQRGTTSGAVWDLDRIARTGDWTLGILDADELVRLPHVDELDKMAHGTIVLWEEFDRALAGEADPTRALERQVDDACAHLELAFHRYIDGGGTSGVPKTRFLVNGRQLAALDPYLTHLKSERELPDETVVVEGAKVRIVPYILPHLSKLKKRDIELAGGEEGLRSRQGFYVYRNHRLIIHGTWFRLMPKAELTKLARVRVDIPNSLDHLWSLDVKKSSATPPHAVREALRTFIDRVGLQSERVIRFRGAVLRDDELDHLWQRIETRDGVEYRINDEHPSVRAAVAEGAGSSEVADLVRLVELSLPTAAIYSDMAGDEKVNPPIDGEASGLEAELEQIARGLLQAYRERPGERGRLLQKLPRMDPFYQFPDITARIMKRLSSAE